MKFNELELSAEVLRAIEEMGFTDLTEIQEKAIPLIAKKVDVIGRSNTGTGKTAAFGIPAIESISKEARTPEVLILCPTRELAMQACEEIKKFSKFMPWIRSSAVYGGASMEKQIMELKRGANIVVGTPGRVMDHIRRRTLKLQDLKMIILDEADEMLNMGFREDIESILLDVPEERQTILFSATMPPAILAITNQYQNDPTIITIINKHRTVDTIEQFYFEVPSHKKLEALQLLLLAYEPKASMIFCNTKKMVDELTEALCNKGLRAIGIHGDMKQAQRTHVMERFKNGKVNILIATDVAARGIDVSGIDAVFNFDLPQDNEYYIHRIGRTGRAGKSGTAYTLVNSRKQVYDLRALSKYIKAEIVEKQFPVKEDIIGKKLEKISEKINISLENEIKDETKMVISKLLEQGLTLEKIAESLINLKVQKELKHIPEIDQELFKKTYVAPKKGETRNKGTTVKVDISLGRIHKIAPNFILGALVESTGLSGKSFGKIDIYDKYTTVEVSEGESEHIINSMNGKKVNGKKAVVKLCDKVEKTTTKRYGDKKPRAPYRERDGRENRDNRENRSSRSKSYSKKPVTI